MKKFTFTGLFLISVILSSAQTIPYSSLHEAFESSCGSGGGLPSYWLVFNGIGTPVAGEWQCTATGGRPTSTSAPTAGVECTGTYSGSYHVDTSYLLTPKLSLPPGAANIFFHFDSKAVPVSPNGTLDVFIHDSTAFVSSAPGLEVSSSIIPAIGAGDSTWVTHEANISSLVGAGTFYLAFRYVSNTLSGNIWYLDNVNTDVTSMTLSVKQVSSEKLQLGITESSSSQITLSYISPESGLYNIALYDMLGRELYSEKVIADIGRQVLTIGGLSLHDGMYFVKMGNNHSFGTAKMMIR